MLVKYNLHKPKFIIFLNKNVNDVKLDRKELISLHTYECETCGKIVEIEEVEAVFGHHEHYEHGQCQECFDKE